MTHAYDIIAIVSIYVSFACLFIAIRRHDRRMNVARYIRTRVANVDASHSSRDIARNRVGVN